MISQARQMAVIPLEKTETISAEVYRVSFMLVPVEIPAELWKTFLLIKSTFGPLEVQSVDMEWRQ